MSKREHAVSMVSKLSKLLFTAVAIAFILAAGLVAGAYYVVGRYHQYVAPTPADLQQMFNGNPTTGIVFGSGITPDKEPRPILQQRLEATIELYEAGFLNRIIVSGYHPYERYNEPAAMADYLTENGVPAAMITQDRNGDNTFLTCSRANSEFNVTKAIVITQPSHLDRAIFLCRTNNIEAFGYPAQTTGTQASLSFQSFREALSNVKAVLDSSTSEINL